MMKQDKLDEIFHMAALSALYVLGRIDEGEKADLESWAARSETNRRLFEAFKDEDKRERALQEMRQYDAAEAWRRIRPMIAAGRPRRRRWMVAAAVTILLAGSGLLLHDKRAPRVNETVRIVTTRAPEAPVIPGGPKATLILGNGSALQLKDRQDSAFRQGSSMVVQQQHGSISYTSTPGKVEEIQYNTLITPRGGEYNLVLADGTRVWLNAASSLRYPTAFTAGQRVVQLTGEAYFEVSAHPTKPFIVKVDDCRIEVLGTHFDVNAYQEGNSIRTTLAEGSVRVLQGDQDVLLKPGEQAKMDDATGTFRRINVNVDEVMAWKDDQFYFDDTNIEDIMQEIARWYNVEVVYKTKDLANKKFSGIMSRYSDVNAVLKRMELTKTVRFEVTGRTIAVMDWN